ncbi:hypothetical protein C439_02432 [Haloferax mediterranei ATCC 33500]|nr:hypothetical protein BM92_01065 [Haloferax mediterranei ATCC 33500]EMA04495.1 hypothetical protein C439_02432 [Haloferax mediterranei ATCC 33500]
MSHAAGNDVTQQAPEDIIGDPLESFSAQMDSFGSLISLVFDDYENFIDELVRKVIELPPERRFTHSHEIVEEQVSEEFGTADVLSAQFPQLNGKQLSRFMSQINEQILKNVLRGIYFDREPDTRLVLAALVQSTEHFMSAIEDNQCERAVRQRSYSAPLGLLCRLMYTARNPDESTIEDIAMDVSRSHYYFGSASSSDSENPPNPDNRPSSEVIQEVREYGAAIAYANTQISLGRGSELAHLTEREFRTRVLKEHKIPVRNGPQSAEDLGDRI